MRRLTDEQRRKIVELRDICDSEPGSSETVDGALRAALELGVPVGLEEAAQLIFQMTEFYQHNPDALRALSDVRAAILKRAGLDPNTQGREENLPKASGTKAESGSTAPAAVFTTTPARGPEEAGPARARWRVGTKLGRTLYFDERFVGCVDTPGLAIILVAGANAWLDEKKKHAQRTEPALRESSKDSASIGQRDIKPSNMTPEHPGCPWCRAIGVDINGATCVNCDGTGSTLNSSAEQTSGHSHAESTPSGSAQGTEQGVRVARIATTGTPLADRKSEESALSAKAWGVADASDVVSTPDGCPAARYREEVLSCRFCGQFPCPRHEK